MVQSTDIVMFILFLSGKWCPHTEMVPPVGTNA
jgi:hypothetical protein